MGTFSAKGLALLHKVRCSNFRHLLPCHSHNNIVVKPSFDFYDSSSWFAGVPFKFASDTYNTPGYQWNNNLHDFHCLWCSSAHPLDPISCNAFCPRLDDHLQAFLRAWPAPFTSVVQYWWITCSCNAEKQSFARTLLPTSLWSVLQVPIPGPAASAHLLELNSALTKRQPALKDALYHAHGWFWDSPQPWDPINWAHLLTAITPWRVPHGPYSTFTPPTILRAKPQYKPPPPAHKTVYPPPEGNGTTAKREASTQAVNPR